MRDPDLPADGPVKLGQLVWYFLRLGTFGFGGPIALAGYMQRDPGALLQSHRG